MAPRRRSPRRRIKSQKSQSKRRRSYRSSPKKKTTFRSSYPTIPNHLLIQKLKVRIHGIMYEKNLDHGTQEELLDAIDLLPMHQVETFLKMFDLSDQLSDQLKIDSNRDRILKTLETVRRRSQLKHRPPPETIMRSRFPLSPLQNSSYKDDLESAGSPKGRKRTQPSSAKAPNKQQRTSDISLIGKATFAQNSLEALLTNANASPGSPGAMSETTSENEDGY